MASAIDLLTMDEAMAAINMVGSGTNHEDQIEVWITAVSQRVDDLCGPVVIRTITDELHDANGSLIFLDYSPVSSVTTVTEYVSGTGTVLTAEDIDTAGGYLLRDGILSRRSGFYSTSWNGRIKVTYEAGRFADSPSVDAKFKLAAGTILRRLWAREAPAWARGGDPFVQEGAGVGFFGVVDFAVNEFLGGERRAPAIA